MKTFTALVLGGGRPYGNRIVHALHTAGYDVRQSLATATDSLNLLVVNSPVEPRRIGFRDLTDADFAAPLEEQLYEFVEAVQFSALRMAGGGSIVHIVSNAHLGTWDGAHIAASAAAAIAMARSMALELAAQNIRVNSLAPDLVGARGDIDAHGDELAATVVWLGGPDSRLVSGETILLNRGRSLLMNLAARKTNG